MSIPKFPLKGTHVSCMYLAIYQILIDSFVRCMLTYCFSQTAWICCTKKACQNTRWFITLAKVGSLLCKIFSAVIFHCNFIFRLFLWLH